VHRYLPVGSTLHCFWAHFRSQVASLGLFDSDGKQSKRIESDHRFYLG
jgi:hypothetical protein